MDRKLHAMSADAAGRNLFIVHDSVSSWTGLRYLKERAGISRSFDFATGFFDIGALLEPDGEWQRVDRIRLLMGTETSHRTPRALIDSVRARAVDALDRSLEGRQTKQTQHVPPVDGGGKLYPTLGRRLPSVVFQLAGPPPRLSSAMYTTS